MAWNRLGRKRGRGREKKEEREREKGRHFSKNRRIEDRIFFIAFDAMATLNRIVRCNLAMIYPLESMIVDCFCETAPSSACAITFEQRQAMYVNTCRLYDVVISDVLPCAWHIRAFESHYFLTTRGIVRIHDALEHEEYVPFFVHIIQIQRNFVTWNCDDAGTGVARGFLANFCPGQSINAWLKVMLVIRTKYTAIIPHLIIIYAYAYKTLTKLVKTFLYKKVAEYNKW